MVEVLLQMAMDHMVPRCLGSNATVSQQSRPTLDSRLGVLHIPTRLLTGVRNGC